MQAMSEQSVYQPGDDAFDRYHAVSDAERALARRLVPNPAWIRYCAADGQVTERIVEVAALHPYDGHLYIVSHCRLRADQRTFRADRVLQVAFPATGEALSAYAWIGHVMATSLVPESKPPSPSVPTASTAASRGDMPARAGRGLWIAAAVALAFVLAVLFVV
jgi:hypothetical protein